MGDTLLDEVNLLRAANAELRRLLAECATRLLTCATLAGNARWAVEPMVRTYLDPIGVALPPWPAGVPEDGTEPCGCDCDDPDEDCDDHPDEEE